MEAKQRNHGTTPGLYTYADQQRALSLRRAGKTYEEIARVLGKGTPESARFLCLKLHKSLKPSAAP